MCIYVGEDILADSLSPSHASFETAERMIFISSKIASPKEKLFQRIIQTLYSILDDSRSHMDLAASSPEDHDYFNDDYEYFAMLHKHISQLRPNRFFTPGGMVRSFIRMTKKVGGSDVNQEWAETVLTAVLEKWMEEKKTT